MIVTVRPCGKLVPALTDATVGNRATASRSSPSLMWSVVMSPAARSTAERIARSFVVAPWIVTSWIANHDRFRNQIM